MALENCMTRPLGQDERAGGMMPVFAMALGTFAIGTESFMIAPLLPDMAADLGDTPADIVWLITAFTLTLALSSPFLTVLSGSLDRRRLLVGTMAGFTLANLWAFNSTDFGGILAARIMLAATAGLYIPNANALAGAVAGPKRHGRALAIVSGGMTIAIALGLPIGAAIGHALGWRATFLAVAVLGIVAAAGIALGVDRRAGAGIRVPGLGERLGVALRPDIQKPLAVTLFWGIGAYSAYPVIAPYLSQVLGFGPGGIGAMVSLWGVAAALGVVIGGSLADRFGPAPVIAPSLLALVVSFLVLALAGLAVPQQWRIYPVLWGVAVWGCAVWGFFPAQLARLVKAAGPASSPVALSLNTSVMYFGFAAGSAIGSAVLGQGAAAPIYLVSAGAEIVAYLLFRLFTRRGRPA